MKGTFKQVPRWWDWNLGIWRGNDHLSCCMIAKNNAHRARKGRFKKRPKRRSNFRMV